MGTVDIEETVEEVMLSDRWYWDGEYPPYEEMKKIVREVVTKVTEFHYSHNDGEIDDWDVWEQDIVAELNERMDKLLLGEDM